MLVVAHAGLPHMEQMSLPLLTHTDPPQWLHRTAARRSSEYGASLIQTDILRRHGVTR